MELYLLRHGLSGANIKRLVTGTKKDALSIEGEMQARSARRLLQYFNLDGPSVCRFVSNWKRAQETAALVVPNRDFIPDFRLGETDAGTAANMPLAEFSASQPQFWGNFDPERSYPGGESHRQLFDRVSQWRAELEQTLSPDAVILAVTHAGPICCLLHAVCGVSMDRFPMFIAGNASLTKLEQGNDGIWRLAFFSLPPEIAS